MVELNPVEARVLGVLMEKEVTTPEYYPLSLNALVAGCNQKSSREPVLQLSERECEAALRALDGMELVRADHGSRVERYENRARTVFHLRRDETALLCLLLLRGPQTPGELRSRAERLFAFDDVPQVLSALQRMSAATDERPGPLVQVLARQPGSREARYAQLLTGAPPEGMVQATDTRAERTSANDASAHDRIAALEATVAQLRQRVRSLEEQLGVGAVQEDANA